MQSQAVVFSVQALVCLSAKSWRFVSFGRSFNFQLLWKSPSLIPTEKRQVASLNGKNIWEFEIPFHLFAQGVSKCTPIFGSSLKNFYKNLSFHLFPLGRAELSGVFENFFILQKTPSLIWTKGAEMHTRFWGFLRKNFCSLKIPPHLFGIAKPNDTLFHRKNEKIFFGCGCFILLASKNPFTYSHWEQPNAPPKSKNFLKRLFVSKSPHPFPLGKGVWGQWFWKKEKNMPTESGGQR